MADARHPHQSPDHANDVWNRALFWTSEDGIPGAGDRALTALLRAHGMVMSGGIGHCHETLSAEHVRDAIDGFRWYGLDEAGSLLESTALASATTEWDDDASLSADQAYDALIPSDAVLDAAFRARYMATPDAFTALRPMPLRERMRLSRVTSVTC